MIEDATAVTGFLSCSLQEQDIGSSVGLKPAPDSQWLWDDLCWERVCASLYVYIKYACTI